MSSESNPEKYTKYHGMKRKAFYGRCADCLAKSFMEEPQYTKDLPKSPKSRYKKLHAFNLLLTRYADRVDGVVANPEFTGVILFLPPDDNEITAINLLRAGVLWAGIRMGYRFSKALLKGLKKTAGLESRVADITHIKPIMFGVHPDHRGKGIGTELAKMFWDRVEKYDVPIFVETHAARNVEIYKHFGAITKEVLNGDHTKYGMLYYPAQEKDHRDQLIRKFEEKRGIVHPE